MNKLSRKRDAKHTNCEYRSALLLYEANDGDCKRVHSILKSQNPNHEAISISTLKHFPRAINDARSSTPAASIKYGIKNGYYTRGMAQACIDRYCPGVVDIDAMYGDNSKQTEVDIFTESSTITISVDEYTALKGKADMLEKVISERDVARKYAEEYERAYQEEKSHRIDVENKLDEIKQLLNS